MEHKEITKLLQEKVDEIYKICKENGIETLSVCVRPLTKYATFFNNHWETDKRFDRVKMNGKWHDIKGEENNAR
jgi:hypothetical protein